MVCITVVRICYFYGTGVLFLIILYSATMCFEKDKKPLSIMLKGKN